ncbi:MAG: nicotinate-nucleotide adenylyltransferase [Terriglobia bacterium]
MKIGIFGGTFDPIHSGHMAVARAAVRRFRLDRIYFVPSGTPPHKSHHRLTAFLHRYTMVALACSDEPRFVPSLLEAGPDLTGRARHYSVDTVRHLRRRWPRAHLYFILGADQFLTLPAWKNYRTLSKLCDFMVAARPGFRLDSLRAARVIRKLGEHARVYLLTAVHADVSASRIRQLARRGGLVRSGRARPALRDWPAAAGWVLPAVADYIRSTGLYRRS